jgi:hypothetical protein
MDEERRPAADAKASELLGRAGQGLEITTRDDQYDFTAFLDAARTARRSGGRLRLVDTGKLNAFELEWLAEAGADLFTSDEARSIKEELGLLARACLRGDSAIAFFQRGPLAENGPADAASWAFLQEVGRDGLDIHLSSRERERDLTAAAETAHVCRKAGSRLVYYHHGPLAAGLEALAGSGAWIHFTDEALDDAGSAILLGDVIRAAAAAGGGVVLHLEKAHPVETLDDCLNAGAYLLFGTLPSDRRSRLGLLEERARKKRLDRRAYYIHASFLP